MRTPPHFGVQFPLRCAALEEWLVGWVIGSRPEKYSFCTSTTNTARFKKHFPPFLLLMDRAAERRPSAAQGTTVGWMGLLCAAFKPLCDILKEPLPMYHRNDQNSIWFNSIYQTIAVNQSFANMVISDLGNYAPYQRKFAGTPRSR
jgi:hypothetical protein